MLFQSIHVLVLRGLLAFASISVAAATGAGEHGNAPFPIDSSCNVTLRAQLSQGLWETVALAEVAKAHLLRHGHGSPFVQKYFGNASTATPIGWYERVISADRTGMLFRCDDPDENCATQDGWAGHWRGSNATEETVICDRSFEVRRYLNSFCGLGYTVAGSDLPTFWAVDLLHRLFHVPKINEGVLDHFAEGYSDALRLAVDEPERTTIDSEVLQYFAADVYAHDIAVPGVGCTGEPGEDDGHGHGHSHEGHSHEGHSHEGHSHEGHSHEGHSHDPHPH